MRYTYLISIIFLLTMCNHKKKSTANTNEDNKIDSVFITYYCGNIDSNVAIKCEKIATIQQEHTANDYSLFREGIVEVIDTFIIEQLAIEKIKILLEKKETINNYPEDARMYVTIKYTNDSTNNICLGMNTPQAMFNGLPVLIEDELVYLLRANSGYYRWFDRKDLDSFKEYRDFHE